MTTNTFNTEISQLAIDKIKSRPDLFNQRAWNSDNECGTAHCWFGWCVQAYLTKRHNPIRAAMITKDIFFGTNEIIKYAKLVVGLEFNGDEFSRMADGDNTIEDIEFYHDRLSRGLSIEYDRYGFNSEGFDSDGFGYDYDGYDCDGVYREFKRAQDDYNRAEYYRASFHGASSV